MLLSVTLTSSLLLSRLAVPWQAKNLLMAIYFAADHVVWAGQAGVYTNKEALDRCA